MPIYLLISKRHCDISFSLKLGERTLLQYFCLEYNGYFAFETLGKQLLIRRRLQTGQFFREGEYIHEPNSPQEASQMLIPKNPRCVFQDIFHSAISQIIVIVNTEKERRLANRGTPIVRPHLAAMLLPKILYGKTTFVLPRQNKVACVVGRTVIHHHPYEISTLLLKQTIIKPPQQMRPVIGRSKYRQRLHFHTGILSLTVRTSSNVSVSFPSSIKPA